MQASKRLVDYTKNDEKLITPARHLPADAASVITAGWGETDPRLVHAGMQVTEALADSWLQHRLDGIGLSVTHLCKTPPTQGQFDAFCHFAYNAGLGALARSTMLAKYNSGDLAGAAAAFPSERVTSNGIKRLHLVAVREDEQRWFLEA